MQNEQPSSKPPLSKEEFQAWAEGHLSRLVLERLRVLAEAERDLHQSNLFSLSSYPPEAWAEEQPRLAYRKGRYDALVEVVGLTYEDLWADEPEVKREEANV